MKVIPLTQGLFAKVDDIDYERVVNYGSWYAMRNRYSIYARHKFKGRVTHMHSFILGIKDVDHINSDGLDNQRANLRPATNSQNQMNKMKSENKTSIYKGVHEQDGRWIAMIRANKKREYLGYFQSEDDAALAYNEAAKRLFGEFALLNVVGIGTKRGNFTSHTDVSDFI